MEQKSLTEKVTALVDAHTMLPVDRQTPVVLMVSGGSDSVALARLLPILYPQHSYTVLHVNHQLRGEDAEKDELFVTQLSRELGLPCELRHIDVGVLAAETGDNLEQAGRTARYREANALLDALCEQAGVEPVCGRIVTAHTLDDRVETFFMRTIVGGGVSGLSSIPPVNARVIRPLLACTREELRTYVLSLPKLPSPLSPQKPSSPQTLPSCKNPQEGDSLPAWREDITNTDTSKLRAFVRHELIPLAKTRNPELLHTVERTLDVLGAEGSFLEQQTLALFERAQAGESRLEEGEPRLKEGKSRAPTAELQPQVGELRLEADTLFSASPVLVRRVVREACKQVMPETERITHEHIVNIAANGKRVGFVTDTPGAVTVANEYGTLVFRREGSTDNRVESTWKLVLAEGSSQELPDGRVIRFNRLDTQQFAGDPVGFARAHATDTQVFIDGEALARTESILTVSALRVGDRMCPLGMNGRHKLVSHLLVDRKIPRRKRAELLKVCACVSGSEEIVWIIDVSLDDRYKVSAKTTSMFSIIVLEPEQG